MAMDVIMIGTAAGGLIAGIIGGVKLKKKPVHAVCPSHEKWSQKVIESSTCFASLSEDFKDFRTEVRGYMRKMDKKTDDLITMFGKHDSMISQLAESIKILYDNDKELFDRTYRLNGSVKQLKGASGQVDDDSRQYDLVRK